MELAMQISSEEALSALKEVDTATARRAELRSYQVGSSHLFLWGALWIVGYGLSAVFPSAEWWKFWIPISVIGGLASGLFNRRMGKLSGRGALGWRFPAVFLSIFLFIGATYTVMAPRNVEAYLAFPALIVSFAYALVGLVNSPRNIVVGGALFVLTMIGFLFLKPWLPIWLAVVGGGGMILSGLWFRTP
jgi:hypothetical protein